MIMAPVAMADFQEKVIAMIQKKAA